VPGYIAAQLVGTAFLLAFVFALTDERNQAPRANLAPAVIGLVVVAVGLSFGANAGYAINPARDFGPRLFTAVAGWGSDVFRAGHSWWWVPIAGPLIGGLVGGFVYDAFISRYHPIETNDD
jgi:glycerol uptake facilitator-like aquaporin